MCTLTDEEDALRAKDMKNRAKEDKWGATSGQLLQDHSRWDYVIEVVLNTVAAPEDITYLDKVIDYNFESGTMKPLRYFTSTEEEYVYSV